METEQSTNGRQAWPAIALVLVCLLSHAPILSAGFVWDDFTLVRDNQGLRDPANLVRFFTEDLGHINVVPRDMGFYRPLQSLSFFVEGQLFGLNAPGYHLTNLLLHLLACFALLGIARRIGFSPGAAFFIAALFAVLPGKSEEVFLIANRGGVMAAALVLGSLWAHLRSLEQGGRGYAALSLLLFVLGLLSKETAIVAPALVVLTTVLVHRALWQPGGFSMRWKLSGAGHSAVAFVYLIGRFGLLNIQSPASTGVDLSRAMLSMPYLLFRYLRLLVLPYGLTPEHSFGFLDSVFSPLAIFSWAALIALAVLVVLAKKWTGLSYGLLFFFVALVPVLNLVPLHRPFSEHYLYLPAAGFCLAIGALGDRLLRLSKPARQAVVAAGLIGLVAYGAINVRNASFWREERTLWERAVAVEPNSRSLNNLATCYWEQGDLPGAHTLMIRSLQGDPANYKAAFYLARVAMELESWDEARKRIEYALRLKPDYLRAAVAAGVIGYELRMPLAELDRWSRGATSRPIEVFRGYGLAAHSKNDKAAVDALEEFTRSRGMKL